MAKFNADTAVEKMEIDFSKYDGPSGVIPEPSNDQVSALFRRLNEVRREVRGEEPKEDGEEGDDTKRPDLSDLTEEQEKAFQRKSLEAFEAVTSGFVTVDALERLPFRVQRVFINWFLDELNPEA